MTTQGHSHLEDDHSESNLLTKAFDADDDASTTDGDVVDGSSLPAKDTSYQAWVVTIFASLARASALSILYVFGVYVIPLTEEFNMGRGAVSWIGSITYFTAYFLGGFVGMANTYVGPRVVVMCGGFMVIVMGLSASYSPWFESLFVFIGVFAGIGVSCSSIPTVSAVITWFDKYRGLATGIAASGSGVGNMVAPLVAQALMTYGSGADEDWRFSVRYMGIGCGALQMFSGLFIRMRSYNSSSSSGDGKAAVQRQKEVLAQQIRNASVVMKTRSYRLFLGYAAVGSLAFNVPILHVQPFSKDQGLSDTDAALMLSIMGIAQIFSRIMWGHLADRFGSLQCLILSAVVMSVITILWPFFFTSYALIVFFVVMYGICVGGNYALPPAVIGEYWTGVNPSRLLGWFFSVGCVQVMMGPVIGGYIFDATGSYRWTGVMCGIALLTAQCFLVTMFIEVRRDGKLKISDFGNAKSVSDSERSSGSGSRSERSVGEKPAQQPDTEKTKLLRSVVSVSSNS